MVTRQLANHHDCYEPSTDHVPIVKASFSDCFVP
jgi:hypothetical protein